MGNDNTKRFSNRVEDYVKYRPGYPVEIIRFLQDKYGLAPGKRIADIGSGTGITTALFLDAGYEVTAVEPNTEMREKSIELLGANKDFYAVGGSAEMTGLMPHSVDAIIAGQAFHWFDRPKAKAEFKRILKTNGIVVLIWNERLTESSFEQEYDEMILRNAIDYVKVDHRNIDAQAIAEFFSPAHVEYTLFKNKQVFDFDGVLGRLLSSSYMPAKGDPGYSGMYADLKNLFNTYEKEGVITINYDTKVYSGYL